MSTPKSPKSILSEGSSIDETDLPLQQSDFKEALEQEENYTNNYDKKNKRYLFELRKAFDEADVEQKGWLSLEQWMNSTLRNFIQNGKMTDDQFEKYFRRIDANSDARLTWQELVLYMIQEITTRDLKIDNETTRLITKAKLPAPPRSQQHRDMILHMLICNRTGDYVTLSQDSIRFWSPSDLTCKQAIIEPGYFSDFYIFDYPFILVAATTERRLIFYELETYTVLPVEISASPSAQRIKQMQANEAQNILKALDSPMMPMFNVPKALCEAEYPDRSAGTLAFFIGDDEGIIEVFQLTVPQRRNGNDYTVARIARSQIHNRTVNQIAPIELLHCYASSSMDHSVKFWTFSGNSFSVIRTFSDNSPIDGFIFADAQKVLVTYGPSRDAYVWGISPPHKMFKLGDHYNQLECISDFVTTNKEAYLVTITNRKEFRIWDSMNYRPVHEWSDPSMQRPENHYSVAKFDHNRHCLITCSAYPSKWAEDFTTKVTRFDDLTHNYSIIGCFYSKDYDQLVTVDIIRTIKLWDYKKGVLETLHKDKRSPDSSQISASCLDNSSRRLITATFDGNITVWNFNSGQEITNFVAAENSLISIVQCIIISNREFLICCRWDKVILLFSEVESCEYELYRSFIGHKTDITAIAQSNFGLVSGDASGIVYSWTVNTSSPQSTGKIDTGGSVEAIVCNGYNVIVGDSTGTITVFNLPRMNMVRKFDAHGIVRQYSITSLIIDVPHDLLFSGDTFGYVKKYNLKTFEGIGINRCHQDDILSLTIIDDGKTLVTCGMDKTVRMWNVEDFGYYGFFSDEGKWINNGECEADLYNKPSPFECDPLHFERKDETMTQRNTNRRNAILFKHSPLPNQSDSKTTTRGINVTEKQEPEPFDFNKFSETMDDFMQEMNGRPKRMIDFSKTETTPQSTGTFAITQPLTQLETTTRPSDLINQIDNLCQRKYNGQSSTGHLSSLNINLVRPGKRPQRQIRKSHSRANATFGSNRLPLTLQLV